MAAKISWITPFRVTDSYRERNFVYLLDWYRQIGDYEFLILEQDDRPRLNSEQFPADVKHIFAVNPGAFNKSWGINTAARQASLR